jgi:hypothetical protein
MGHGLARVAAGAAAMLTTLGFITSAGAQGAQGESQADAALVARGAYLARAADCAPCHTGDASKPFAGALGKPKLPVGGVATVALATRFATQNPKATPADLANALIAAYCPVVTAARSIDPADRFSWLEGFGEQVIQTLQIRTMGLNVEPASQAKAARPGSANSRTPSHHHRHRA